jgi:hypothetical protein
MMALADDNSAVRKIPAKALQPPIATQFRGQPAVVRCSTVVDKADSVKMFNRDGDAQQRLLLK